MDKLHAMQLFIGVVDAQSFTRAAARLNISRAMASKMIGELEKQVGGRLLNRTTRRLSLTSIGEAYYRHAVEILSSISNAEAEATILQSKPLGRISISAPMSFGIRHIVPALRDFHEHYPDVQVNLDLSDPSDGLVDTNLDLILRIGLPLDSTSTARCLALYPLQAVASPEYLKLHDIPSQPEDLSKHQCLTPSRSQRNGWVFSTDERVVTVHTTAWLHTNDHEAILRAAELGSGIAVLPSYVVQKEISSGALQCVLPSWGIGDVGIYMVYPATRALPMSTHSLIEFLLKRFGADHDWSEVLRA